MTTSISIHNVSAIKAGPVRTERHRYAAPCEEYFVRTIEIFDHKGHRFLLTLFSDMRSGVTIETPPEGLFIAQEAAA
jgi:hypothetical protein